MPTLTKAAISRQAIWDRLEQMAENNIQLARNAAKGPLVVRMDEVQAAGEYDRDANGFNAMYRVLVGGEPMHAQVVALGGDLVICFFSALRDHSRRFLVTVAEDGGPLYWMETEERGVRVEARSKYYEPIKRLICLHLHSRDAYSLTARGMAATGEAG